VFVVFFWTLFVFYLFGLGFGFVGCLLVCVFCWSLFVCFCGCSLWGVCYWFVSVSFRLLDACCVLSLFLCVGFCVCGCVVVFVVVEHRPPTPLTTHTAHERGTVVGEPPNTLLSPYLTSPSGSVFRLFSVRYAFL